MMVLFRSSFITATVVCATIVGQFAIAHAAPQFGMRPKLHVLGAEGSGSEFDSLVSATATVDVDVSASSVVLTAEVTTPTAETTQPPGSTSSDDTGTNLSAQSNAAASTASGFGVALLIGSAAALIQIL